MPDAGRGRRGRDRPPVMLPVTIDTVRLTLHILAMSVWVGGQLTLLGLLPVVRASGGDTGRRLGAQFNRIAWPAFAIAVLTGVWNLFAIDVGDTSTQYQASLFAKLFFVALSGIGAFLHGRATAKAAIAGWGAVGLLGGLAAVFYGVLLAG
jgi:putative copper export protein